MSPYFSPTTKMNKVTFFIKNICQRPKLIRIANNIIWLFVDKLISIIAGLLVGAWVARYLGPAQYGLMNYALSFVAMFMPIAGLGLKDIVIRNILRYPKERDEILGTVFVLQFLAGIGSMISLISIAYVFRLGDSLSRLLIIILSGNLVLLAYNNTVNFWFQSQIQSKYNVWAKNLALVVTYLARVVLIISGASIFAFAWANLAQAAVIAILLAFFYVFNVSHLAAWRVSFLQAKQLLKDSWPLIISSLAIMIYLKIDQIMMMDMTTEEELGIYSVAVRLSEQWYFIPVAIASSFFPSIISSRENKLEQVYRERMQLFFDVMVGAAYLIVIPTALFAPLVVKTLFGADYIKAGLILRIHIWALVFVSIGVARSRWLMVENMTRFSMTATILGAIANVGLNFWLIPCYAGVGAAWATLASYCISGFLSCLLTFKLWSVFVQLNYSLLIPFRLPSLVRRLRKSSGCKND